MIKHLRGLGRVGDERVGRRDSRKRGGISKIRKEVKGLPTQGVRQIRKGRAEPPFLGGTRSVGSFFF